MGRFNPFKDINAFEQAVDDEEGPQTAQDNKIIQELFQHANQKFWLGVLDLCQADSANAVINLTSTAHPSLFLAARERTASGLLPPIGLFLPGLGVESLLLAVRPGALVDSRRRTPSLSGKASQLPSEKYTDARVWDVTSCKVLTVNTLELTSLFFSALQRYMSNFS